MGHVGSDTNTLRITHVDTWLSVRQAAQHAGVSEKTIRRAYLSRAVQYTRVGRVVRFRRVWIDDWMLRSQVAVVA